MHITSVMASNFLGIREIDVALPLPVTLFAAVNHQGKSSLQEAIRMAFTGDTVRVSLKKDYPALVRDGAKVGAVAVKVGDDIYSFEVPSGKFNARGEVPLGLPFGLNPPAFGALTAAERRTALFSMLGLTFKREDVTARMVKKGVSEAMVERVLPLLRSGFDTACEESRIKATESKGAWKITAGENWGEKKSEGWKANVADFDADQLATAQAEVERLQGELEQKIAESGALESQARAAESVIARRAELKGKVEHITRIEAKLSTDRAALADWEKTVADTREKASGEVRLQADLICPSCGTLVSMHGGQLVEHIQTKKPDAEAKTQLPIHEKALALSQSAVANGERDLANAKAAQLALAELDDAAPAPTQADRDELSNATRALRAEILVEQKAAAALISIRDSNAAAEECTKKAGELHDDVLAWLKVADLLSPTGIQAEIVEEAIGPINAKLQAHAVATQWKQPRIDAGMNITADGRLYSLLSESEKWRVDAMLAATLADITGSKVLMLDRVDVLDIPSRGGLMDWLDALTHAGLLDTAMMFATLKQAPDIEGVNCFWIENGSIK